MTGFFVGVVVTLLVLGGLVYGSARLSSKFTGKSTVETLMGWFGVGR